MTVQDFILALEKLPPDLPVFVKGYEWGWQTAVAPRLARVQVNALPATYGGPHEQLDTPEDEAFAKQTAEDFGFSFTVIDAVLLPRTAPHDPNH